MKFKSRYTGELVLSKGPIRTRRAIRQGETIELSEKTLEMFGEDVRKLVLSSQLAPADDAARTFVDPEYVPEPVE